MDNYLTTQLRNHLTSSSRFEFFFLKIYSCRFKFFFRETTTFSTLII